VLLRSPTLTGLSWHEWLGVAFLVPMLVHLLLSWRWIVTALRRTFSPPRRRDAVNLLLNVALFVTTSGVVVSGLVISRVALPYLGIATIDDRVWRNTHNSWTDAMLVSVAAHVAMNLRWIINVARPYLTRPLKEEL
jgi:cytochrome b561